MKRTPVVHAEWDYTAGVILTAISAVGKRTGDARFAAFVKQNMDAQVRADGSINTYQLEEYNLDQINQGKLLFELSARTGDARYRTAADQLREQLRRQPRTKEGGYWHKQIYPHQLWLDGVYMASPFLAQYAATYNEPSAFDEVTNEILLVARHLRDPRTGLYYHAWDESRTQPWADPQTGLSKNFWGRAIGWYAMAIVDVLDYLPRTHRDHAAVVRLFQDLAGAIGRVQDPVSGLWYLVLDLPNRNGNYHEASASSMFVYALAKGVRKGWLDARHREIALRGHDGLVRHMVGTDDAGLLSLNRIVSVGGLGGRQQRDGSFEYYLSEPVVANDFKGVGPFILASLELGR